MQVFSHLADRLVLATALRQCLREGYNFQTFRQDFSAALVVSLIALPLAMALAIAVGLPPQQGLYTAIIAGVVVPLLGGSRFQVTGPTAAFVIIIAPIVAQHGLQGLVITEIMAGLFLILLGVARLGHFIHFVPYPVTTGFIAGIAVVLATLSLNDFLGLGIVDLDGPYVHKVELILSRLPQFSHVETAIGLASLIAMALSAHFLKRFPAPVIGIAAGTLLAYFLQKNGVEVSTIGNRFSYPTPNGLAQGLAQGIPPYPPSLHFPSWPSWAELRPLISPALVVAALAALESLLSATVADGITRTKHQPNGELIGLGVGNILSGMAMGMPATGALARTATNVQGGAKTPLAAVFQALLILLYVLTLTPIFAHIPMAALAALLLLVAYRMSHAKQFIRTIQIAPRSDTIVLVTCFLLTVLIDMVAGVAAGLALACFLFMKRVSALTESNISTAEMEENLPEEVMIYRIQGLLFFGTVESALARMGPVQPHIKVALLDLEQVPLIDMTGLVAVKNIVLNLQQQGLRIILCGKPEILSRVYRKLPLGMATQVVMFISVETALNWIKEEKSAI